MKLRGGEVAVVRGKDGRFRVTIPKDLALALGLEGGERGNSDFYGFPQPR
jgi:2-C-methyl-D-erythritol 4-phosphate cytidylyltransferase